jgi:activator of HSP90 ATPase
MGTESVTLRAVIPASADRVYAAWLDAKEHSKMTGGPATVDAQVGGDHSAWDGYISGTILELEPSRRIVQSWRSTDFPLGHSDSRLEVHLRDVDGGCDVTIVHTEIPAGQGAQYEQGWRDHYFEPMARYFGQTAARKRPPAKTRRKKAPAKKAKRASAAKKSATRAKKSAKKTGKKGKRGKRR